MFLLDNPYVSDFMKQSVLELGQSVLDTDTARRLTAGFDLDFIDEIEFSSRLAGGERVLANSENALAYILKCECQPDLARQIDVCKDKALFRETAASLHPDFMFGRASGDEVEIGRASCRERG